MLSAFLPLLVGVILKLDDFVEVIGATFLFDILLNEVAELELAYSQGIVRM